jgi:oxygen-independent coproporphyrinogen-3 oxidase
LGAGAHSKLSFAHRIIRQQRFRDPGLYMEKALAGHCLAQETQLSRTDLPFEFMLNALRLKEGFQPQLFLERTGLPLSAIESGLQEAQAKGLLERDLTRIKPSVRGFDFLNDLQALFLPASS